jgi:hypothetical protein
MIPALDHHATAQTILDHRPTPDETIAHHIAVLSAALLRAVMTTYGENNESFATRAGVATTVIAAAVDGTSPAWTLPYDEFTALADAVATLWPCALFETVTACDLLLTNIVNGDQYLATDVLTDPSSQHLARALLQTAEAMLPRSLQDLLRDRTAELADSSSPDAWVGQQIGSGLIGRQS